MRVVVDTNVVVSAALRDRDPEVVIVFVVENPEFEWVASAAIVEEYIEVLRRGKFRLPEAILRRWERICSELIVAVDVQEAVDFPRDRKDAKFLACALAAQADYFITGDRDFEGTRKIGDTTVIAVSVFKRLVCDTW